MHTKVNTVKAQSSSGSGPRHVSDWHAVNSWSRLGGEPPDSIWSEVAVLDAAASHKPLQCLLRRASGSERLTLNRLDRTEAKVEPKQSSIWSGPAGQRRVQLGLPAVCALEPKSRQISPTDITSQINTPMYLYTESDRQLLCKRENASKNNHILKLKFL